MADSPLKTRITDAMKDAMRAKDKARLGTIRLALSEIKRIEVDERIEPDDARIISILDKMVKQRNESIKQYDAGGRQDLVDQEAMEISILKEFLPEAISEVELAEIIRTAIAETGAQSVKDMGKVMALVKPRVLGRADMAVVGSQIKSLLG
ncbi:MAG: GatB/YqeY domain-containing protein [Pseudohongiellaceae bacterium]